MQTSRRFIALILTYSLVTVSPPVHAKEPGFCARMTKGMLTFLKYNLINAGLATAGVGLLIKHILLEYRVDRIEKERNVQRLANSDGTARVKWEHLKDRIEAAPQVEKDRIIREFFETAKTELSDGKFALMMKDILSKASSRLEKSMLKEMASEPGRNGFWALAWADSLSQHPDTKEISSAFRAVRGNTEPFDPTNPTSLLILMHFINQLGSSAKYISPQEVSSLVERFSKSPDLKERVILLKMLLHMDNDAARQHANKLLATEIKRAPNDPVAIFDPLLRSYENSVGVTIAGGVVTPLRPASELMITGLKSDDASIRGAVANLFPNFGAPTDAMAQELANILAVHKSEPGRAKFATALIDYLTQSNSPAIGVTEIEKIMQSTSDQDFAMQIFLGGRNQWVFPFKELKSYGQVKSVEMDLKENSKESRARAMRVISQIANSWQDFSWQPHLIAPLRKAIGKDPLIRGEFFEAISANAGRVGPLVERVLADVASKPEVLSEKEASAIARGLGGSEGYVTQSLNDFSARPHLLSIAKQLLKSKDTTTRANALNYLGNVHESVTAEVLLEHVHSMDPAEYGKKNGVDATLAEFRAGIQALGELTEKNPALVDKKKLKQIYGKAKSAPELFYIDKELKFLEANAAP